MKIRILTSREKLILWLVLIIFAAVIIFNFGISPVVAKVSRLNDDIEKKTLLLEKYARLIGKGGDIFSLYAQYKANLWIDDLPHEAIAALFKETKNSAAKFNLVLERLKPHPLEKKNNYKEVSLEIELSGDLSSLFGFVNHIENSTSLIKVSTLRLSSQSNSTSMLRCKVILSKIFF